MLSYKLDIYIISFNPCYNLPIGSDYLYDLHRETPYIPLRKMFLPSIKRGLIIYCLGVVCLIGTRNLLNKILTR